METEKDTQAQKETDVISHNEGLGKFETQEISKVKRTEEGAEEHLHDELM